MKVEFFQELVPPKATAQQKGRRTYNPGNVELAKATWKAIARIHKPLLPLQGPLKATLTVTWPYTKAQLKTQPEGPILKDSKPDLDNIEKLLWDALESEGWFSIGDQQIATKTVTKFNGPIPGVYLSIEEVQ